MLRPLRKLPVVVAALRRSPAECVAFEDGGECSVAIKGPGVEPESFLNSSRHVLHDLACSLMPTAPVLYLDIYANGRRCLAVFDLAQPSERHAAEHLTRQTGLKVHFLNEDLDGLELQLHDWDAQQRRNAAELLHRAAADLAAVPRDGYDFARAVDQLREELRAGGEP